MAKKNDERKKSLALVTLGIVAILAIVGLVLLFKGSSGASLVQSDQWKPDENEGKENFLTGDATSSRCGPRTRCSASTQSTKPASVISESMKQAISAPTAEFGKSCCVRKVKGFIDKSGNCRATKGRC